MFKTGGQSVIQAGVWMFRTPVVSTTFPKNLALINVGGVCLVSTVGSASPSHLAFDFGFEPDNLNSVIFQEQSVAFISVAR